MNVSSCIKYVPLCTPALTDSSNKVDGKLLVTRLFIVALAAIGASAAALYTKVNSRTIAKFIALPAACIVIADIARSFYAALYSNPHLQQESFFSAPYSGTFPFENENLLDSLREIMFLDYDQRREAVYNRIAFNSYRWEQCLGSRTCAGEDRKIELFSLPQNIAEILDGPCPVYSDKKVIDTHMLVRIPKKLCGEISVSSLVKLLRWIFPKMDSVDVDFMDSIVSKFGGETIQESYWVLILKEGLPGSKGKPHGLQQQMVQELGGEPPYQVPTLIDSITCLLAQYVGFNKYLLKTDYRLVNQDYCEQYGSFVMYIGGEEDCIRFRFNNKTPDRGVAEVSAVALRKF